MKLSEILNEDSYEVAGGGGGRKSFYVKNSDTHKVVSDRNLTKDTAEKLCAEYDKEKDNE